MNNLASGSVEEPMNRTLLGLAVMVAVAGATVARADDDCGPMPTYAPQGEAWNQGGYQLQTTQTWVPGQQEQVWVPGQCHQRGFIQFCSPGSYQVVATGGHYENRQEWVWVAHSYQTPQYNQDYGRRDYGRRDYGRRDSGRRDYGRQRSGRHHGAISIGF